MKKMMMMMMTIDVMIVMMMTIDVMIVMMTMVRVRVRVRRYNGFLPDERWRAALGGS